MHRLQSSLFQLAVLVHEPQGRPVELLSGVTRKLTRRGEVRRKGTRDDRSGCDWPFTRNVTKPKRS
jgi:hypothetical protein